MTIATAESCTGGLLAAALTSVPGSSAVFKGGVVAYANAAKQALLGVSEDVLRKEGAVSRACVVAMARAVCKRFEADVGVAVTGIAGPGGEVPGKPVGTVWFAVVGRGTVHAGRKHFPGGRAQVRKAAVAEALRLVSEHVATTG